MVPFLTVVFSVVRAVSHTTVQKSSISLAVHGS